MLEFLDKPWVGFVAYGFVSTVFLFHWYMSWPEKQDEETQKERTLYERWKLTSWNLRWYFIIGCLALLVAGISFFEMIGVIEV